MVHAHSTTQPAMRDAASIKNNDAEIKPRSIFCRPVASMALKAQMEAQSRLDALDTEIAAVERQQAVGQAALRRHSSAFRGVGGAVRGLLGGTNEHVSTANARLSLT